MAIWSLELQTRYVKTHKLHSMRNHLQIENSLLIWDVHFVKLLCIFIPFSVTLQSCLANQASQTIHNLLLNVLFLDELVQSASARAIRGKLFFFVEAFMITSWRAARAKGYVNCSCQAKLTPLQCMEEGTTRLLFLIVFSYELPNEIYMRRWWVEKGLQRRFSKMDHISHHLHHSSCFW